MDDVKSCINNIYQTYLWKSLSMLAICPLKKGSSTFISNLIYIDFLPYNLSILLMLVFTSFR